MQESSVSSTTASPGKLIVPVSKPESVSMEITDIDDSESKIHLESHDDEYEKWDKSEGSYKHRHSRHRFHTCSKARRKISSYDRKSSRHNRSRKRRHRSRRSRSSSRHHSSSRRHKPRHKSSEMSSRSSSQSSVSIKSSYDAHISALNVKEPRTGSLDTENTSISPSLSCDNTHHYVVDPTKLGPTVTKGLRELPQLSQSNSNMNALLTLLINGLNSSTQLPSSIIDLLGTINPSLLPPSSFSQSIVTSVVPLSATRQARRLYVGGIPAGVSSDSVVALFNSELRSRGLCQSVNDPVISAQVNTERHFAFIELRSVDGTTAALNLDGISCFGSCLRVRRPRDYMSPNSTTSASSQNVSGDHLSANSIFISGIPSNMQETQLGGLLSAFGPLKSFNILMVR